MGVLADVDRAEIRAFAESNMEHTVRFERGHATLDATTLVATWVVDTVVYSGKAHVHPITGSGTVEVGEGQVAQRQGIVSVPWDAPIPRTDDTCVIVSQPQDPTLEGSGWRIIGVGGGGLVGAYREVTVSTWYPNAVWSPA